MAFKCHVSQKKKYYLVVHVITHATYCKNKKNVNVHDTIYTYIVYVIIACN
jgi:hypothetical protein